MQLSQQVSVLKSFRSIYVACGASSLLGAPVKRWNEVPDVTPASGVTARISRNPQYAKHVSCLSSRLPQTTSKQQHFPAFPGSSSPAACTLEC